MDALLKIIFLISFYFMAVSLHSAFCDDVPSAEADTVVTESEEHYTASDDLDF
ncbi:uncharacterized protein LOC108115161 [Drosophila eugracilis]|uniref:uncharacterized protein LOC108115161 n=1 Tax=Drosophila eugracilis TaxID=29029 RepID=UPI001BD98CC3|nr:uncharacterized protein LOC108115161 [Drosophila eugracilis]